MKYKQGFFMKKSSFCSNPCNDDTNNHLVSLMLVSFEDASKPDTWMIYPRREDDGIFWASKKRAQRKNRSLRKGWIAGY